LIFFDGVVAKRADVFATFLLAGMTNFDGRGTIKRHMSYGLNEYTDIKLPILFTEPFRGSG